MTGVWTRPNKSIFFRRHFIFTCDYLKKGVVTAFTKNTHLVSTVGKRVMYVRHNSRGTWLIWCAIPV